MVNATSPGSVRRSRAVAVGWLCDWRRMLGGGSFWVFELFFFFWGGEGKVGVGPFLEVLVGLCRGLRVGSKALV